LVDTVDETDYLILPFGLLMRESTIIDSIYQDTSTFKLINGSLVTNIDQSNLYKSISLKAAAVLEFYPEEEISQCKLYFDPRMKEVDARYTNVTFQINVGNGFQAILFNGDMIDYDRKEDSIVSKIVVNYTFENANKSDTIKFYLTTEAEPIDLDKSSSNSWDYHGSFNEIVGIDFKYGVKRGCGNVDKKLRRPIILVPPYRPIIQPVSLKKYYKQFNFKQLIDNLSEKGYDVIFIKLKPGNAHLSLSGRALAKFIKYINTKKTEDYPYESWENVVGGFSMGGQVARYALMYGEDRHMTQNINDQHHHTRLYIPFDSPHLGANVPMFTQAVYKDLRYTNILAAISYSALTDDASSDMAISSINANAISVSGNVRTIYPDILPERTSYLNELENFHHIFSNTGLGDQRNRFPAFTRNIAVSVGSNEQDYNAEFGLNPGKLLFEQNNLFAIGTGFGGSVKKTRFLWASNYGSQKNLFYNKVVYKFLFLFPVVLKNHLYRTENAIEWDMAQGGYKDQFYSKVSGGAVPILRSSVFFFLGTKHYKNHVSFLPLISAFAVKPSIWANNNLLFDTKQQGLMYTDRNLITISNASNTYGYPNVGHIYDHFNITPFEAIYTDPQTYEHIKMQASITQTEPNLDQSFLYNTRNFIVDEVEADHVKLQNKIIGKNHIQNLPSYKYKAWYKASLSIELGREVTAKTDVGDYIIESTGDITTYAGESVTIKPGFHTKQGSSYRAYIGYQPCNNKSLLSHDTESSNDQLSSNGVNVASRVLDPLYLNEIEMYPNPAKDFFNIKVTENWIEGKIKIVTMSGVIMQSETIINVNQRISSQFKSGTYIIVFTSKEGISISKLLFL
jgi:hypothetical protein